MPEDPNFGDIDDVQLEAAMAVLLQTSSASRVPPPSSASPAPSYDSALAADQSIAPASAGSIDVDDFWLPEAESEGDRDPDLEVSPWAAAPAEAAVSSLALEESGFGGPLHTALGDSRDLNDPEAFESPPPPLEPPLPASTTKAPQPNYSRPWSSGFWTNHGRELVPALVVACLVILGLAAVVTTMTRDDGSGDKVSLSTPTSVRPTTTIAFATIPPPPAPLPVDVAAPDTTATSPSSGLVPKRFRAPAKSAPAPAGSSAPAPSGAAPTAAPAPAPNPAPTQNTSPPTTSPPATSPPTTEPPTTSPPTTEPRDPCDLIEDPVRQQLCHDRTGG